MSSPSNTYIYRMMFRLRLHESSGAAFQAFFNRLMAARSIGFESINAWGNWGDGGNDGWIPSEKHYFQLYGPTNSTFNPLTACQKALKDYTKLSGKWAEVKKYSFVINDKFAGIPAPLASELAALPNANAVGSEQILSWCMELAEDLRNDLLGGMPPDNSSNVLDLTAIGDLLRQLADRPSNGFGLLRDTAPDFSQKLEFNGLTAPVSDFLQADSWQVSLIDEFLDAGDLGFRQTISQEVKRLYLESKVAIPDTDPEAANGRYFWLLNQIKPKSGPSLHPHSAAAYDQASRLVIAKYFESCDAYDHPINATTA